MPFLLFVNVKNLPHGNFLTLKGRGGAAGGGGVQICPRMDFLLTLHVEYLGPYDCKNVFIHFNKDFNVSGEHTEVLPISDVTWLIILES